MKYWPSIRKQEPSHIQRDFRGVNKQDAFTLPDDFATDMKNLTSSNYPALTVRPGFTLLGSAFASKILGLGVRKDSELHAVANGVWYKWTGSAWSQLLAGMNTAAEWSFANFKGNLSDISLIAANGIDPIKVCTDGVTVSNLATAPAGGNYIEQYADRLYCAKGNELHFTAYRMANDWTTTNGDDADSGYIIVETPNGELINAVKAGIGHVTIFKPGSIHELFGSSPSDYRMQPVTFDIGAINNKCVVTVNSVMYILDNTGLYQYGGGTLPSKDFSLPVQDYIDRINEAAIQACSVGTDGQKLYVSIQLDTATMPDTILEYDPQFKIWTVWKDFSTLQFARMGTNWYMGDNSGKVMQMGGTSDNGAAITWNWVSKPFGSNSLSRKIRWLRMWLVADIPAGSTCNVYLSKSASGDADWVLAGTISGALSSARIPINPGTLANSNWIRVKFSGSGPATIYEFDRDQEDMPIV